QRYRAASYYLRSDSTGGRHRAIGRSAAHPARRHVSDERPAPTFGRREVSVRAVSMAESNAAPVVTYGAALPQPGKGELLIRVCAAGMIATELSWYPTSHRPTGEARERAVLGHEFSGVVTAVGEDVGSLEVGREIFGMNDWFSDGAMADYCVAPFFSVAPKPAHLTHAEA